MRKAKFDPIGKARLQSRLLERIPDPGADPVFLRAAEEAMRHAGLRPETVAVLEELYRRRRSSAKS